MAHEWWHDEASGGITYTQHVDGDGSVTGIPGAVYQKGSNGSISIVYRPPTGGGGTTNINVSNPSSSPAAWITYTEADGSKWSYNEITGERRQLTGPSSPAPPGYIAPNAQFPYGASDTGIDPKTGLTWGVIRDSNSPSGYLYNGKAVNPDGSLYGDGSLNQPGVGDTPRTQVVTYPDGSVNLIDLNTGEILQQLSPPTGPKRSTQVVQRADGSDVLIDTQTGEVIAELGGPKVTAPTLGGAGSGGTRPSTFTTTGSGFGGGGAAAPVRDFLGEQQAGDAAALARLLQEQGWQGTQNDLDRALNESQFSRTFGLNQQQLGLQGAETFGRLASTTDPLAYAAFLHAGGGNIGNAIATGGDALSPAALLPGARALQTVRGLGAGAQAPGGLPPPVAAPSPAPPAATLPPPPMDNGDGPGEGASGVGVPAPLTPWQIQTMQETAQRNANRWPESATYELPWADTYVMPTHTTNPGAYDLTAALAARAGTSVAPKPPVVGPADTFQPEEPPLGTAPGAAINPATGKPYPYSTIVPMARGGLTRAPQLLAGDAAGDRPTLGGAKPEIIFNPTRAPLGVMPHQATEGLMRRGGLRGTPRFATGTGEIVDGHMWDGSQWVAAPTASTTTTASPTTTSTFSPEATTTEAPANLQVDRSEPQMVTGGTADQPFNTIQPAPAMSPIDPHFRYGGAAGPTLGGVAPEPTTVPGGATAPAPTTPTNLPFTGYGNLRALGGTEIGATGADQAFMDEVRRLREQVQIPDLNLYRADYFGLDPIIRDLFEKALKARFGIPQESSQAEAQKYRLGGLGRGQIAVGY